MSSVNETIWNFFKDKGLSDAGIAGLMGNLFAESGLSPINLEQTFEKKLGYSDTTYTTSTDSGKYKNFVYDSAGYGLAQWTYWSRKKNLLDFAKSKNKSVGDLQVQLDFLWNELESLFIGVLETLKTTTDVLTASNKVLFEFENPSNKSEQVQQTRYSYGMTYFDEFAVKEDDMVQSPLTDFTLISPNKTSPRRNEIDHVTIHCVVGQFHIEGIGQLFNDPNRQASSNYGIGPDGRKGCYVSETDRAWTTGGTDEYKNEIFVNGISGSMNDHRAITIEVACDPYYPYAITDAAKEGLIELLVDICQRYPKIGKLKWKKDKQYVGNTAVQNITAHRWFARTECPGDYIYDNMYSIVDEVNRRLENIQNVNTNIDEDEDMDVTRFKELWSEMRKDLQDNDSYQWSQEAREWAVSTGLVTGGGTDENGNPNYMWEDVLTREQFVTVLYRFAKEMGKI